MCNHHGFLPKTAEFLPRRLVLYHVVSFCSATIFDKQKNLLIILNKTDRISYTPWSICILYPNTAITHYA